MSGITDGAVADFNEDGYADVALTFQARGFLTALADGNGGFIAKPFLPLEGSTRDPIAVGDFNGDGHSDLVVGYGAQLQVWFNDGADHWTAGQVIGTWGGAHDVVPADLDGDGVLDLAVAVFDGAIEVWRGDGTGAFTLMQRHTTDRWLVSVAVGDFNEDGVPDLATATETDVLIFRNQGGLQFALASRTPIPANAGGLLGPTKGAVQVGDFDGDGHLDLAANSEGYAVVAYFGDGTAALGRPVVMSHMDGSQMALAVGDLNGDGLDDIVQGGVRGAPRIYLANAAGGFAPPIGPLGLCDNDWVTVTPGDDGGGLVLLAGDLVAGLSKWVPSEALSGVVSDVAGEGIVGATVTVDSGESTTTGLGGTYRFISLVPGTHTVIIAKPGYDSRTLSDVRISVGMAATGNVTLTRTTYTLVYQPGVGGTIAGAMSQTVYPGLSGTPVVAVANPGYHFVRWSDGIIANPRIETDVVAPTTVSAIFAPDRVVTSTRLSAPASVQAHKALRLSGTVSPGGPGRVTIAMQRKVGGKWKSAGHLHAGVTGCAYRCSPKLKYRGSWRLSATYTGGVSEGTVFTGSKTKYVYVKVR